MPNRNLIVIGGSSGSSEPLKRILAALPADLPASVFVSTHMPAHAPSHLVQLLGAVSRLPVVQVGEGQAIESGRVHVAVPDRHVVLTADGIRLGSGPRENMARPSIDPLFRSAALAFGPRTIGVILSGGLNDGASGLEAIKRCGGLAVVQSPADAEAADMPRAALSVVDADYVAPAEEIGPLLAGLAGGEAGPEGQCPDDLRLEVDIALGERLGARRLGRLADSVALTCPECSGVLSEIRGAKPMRFRCQTGHAVTADILGDHQDGAVEEALRVALRVVEERVELVTKMAEEARRLGRRAVAELYESRAQEYAGYAEVLRRAAIAAMDEPETAQSA